MGRILSEVVERRDFFEQHPKALAYWMGWYDNIHYASRFDKDEKLHDWDNLKYDVIDLEETVGEEYANLVYDAWGVNIREGEDSKRGKLHKLEGKINKTMDEWVKLSLDPAYRYNCIFPNRTAVLNYLLCVIGTGLDWNKEGFICNMGPSGTDLSVFHGYNSVGKRNLPKALVNLVETWKQHKIISSGFRRFNDAKRKEQRKKKERDDAMDVLLATLPKTKSKPKSSPQIEFYPMCEYSKLVSMPENAHESYKNACKEICEAIVNTSKDKRNVKIAKKFIKNN